jgi:flagellar biosynthetic protein FliP
MILEFNKNEYLISQTNNGIQILEKPKFKKETKKAKLIKTKDKEKKTVQSKLDSLIKRKANYIGVASLLLIILLIPDISYAQSIDLTSIKSNSSFLQIFLLITFLSVAPAILLMMTPFTRIAISLSLLKQAMGIPAIPSNQIIAGLAIFLTFFIMRPEVENLSKKVIEPYSNGAIDYKQALSKGSDIMKQFMYKHVRKIDLENFVKLSKIKNTKEVPMSILIPAFVTSELKTAFQIGILIYIPFLLIDLIVSSVLMSMGMIMIPPAMISLPLKLLIFVLVDGWNLITSGLVRSFGV